MEDIAEIALPTFAIRSVSAEVFSISLEMEENVVTTLLRDNTTIAMNTNMPMPIMVIIFLYIAMIS